MNIVAMVSYAIAVALLLWTSAALLERVLSRLRLPVRWPWIAALALSSWLPLASFISDAQPPTPSTPTGATVLLSAAPPGIADGAADTGADEVGSVAGLLAESRALLAGAAREITGILPAIIVGRAWIAVLWGLTSTAVAIVLIGSILRLNRRAARLPDETLLGLRVRISPDLGPATAGLLTPFIVIPRWAGTIPRSELELILQHEAEHVRARDTLLLALGLASAVVCPWNPVLWWQGRRLKAAIEMDCDRRVLRRGVSPAQYGELLLKLGGRGLRGGLAVPTIAGSSSLLERRLTNMLNPHGRTSAPATVAATASSLLLLVIACTTEAPVAADPIAVDPSIGEAAGRSASVAREREVVAIQIAGDGTVRVDGAAHSLDRLSEALAPFEGPEVVVSVQADRAVPYGVVAGVLEQLRTAGLLRVLVGRVDSDARGEVRESDPTLSGRGLATVLPEANSGATDAPRQIPSRNLLTLEALPTGVVVARRGDGTLTQELPARGVEAFLRLELQKNPNVVAVLRTPSAVEFRHMYAVLDAVHRAGATRYSLQLADGQRLQQDATGSQPGR